MSVILEAIIDFVYPKTCVVCGKEGNFLCDGCRVSLKRAEPVCPVCGRASLGGWTHPRCKKKYGLDGLEAIYLYREEKVRKVIEAVKFGFNRELIGVLLKGLSLEEGFDMVVPVPLHRLRLNWRGFNQAEEMGKLLVGGEGKMINVLTRVKNTKQQAKLKSHSERKENVRGAFRVSDQLAAGSYQLKTKKALLVDDVFTTGESMKECARVLKKAGAKIVWGWVLAR